MTAAFPVELIEGYGQYLQKGFTHHKETREHLAVYGQQPQVMVISCCDSRVTPEGIFSAGPGELFVLRNVANLVPPYEATDGQHGTSAAIEYAVRALKVAKAGKEEVVAAVARVVVQVHKTSGQRPGRRRRRTCTHVPAFVDKSAVSRVTAIAAAFGARRVATAARMGPVGT